MGNKKESVMDYEKKYKEALDRARALHKEAIEKGYVDDYRKDYETIFPELKESKDERIRKRLLWFLDNYTGRWDYPETKAACRAWLEKQKELFKSGRGVYYYDGEKTTYCAVVTEDNPNDFAMSQQEKQKEQEHDEGDFTIYHPLKNGKGEYECIPYSFYGSLTSFSEDKDLIDFLRTCFYTKEECNEWIEKQKEQKPIEYLDKDKIYAIMKKLHDLSLSPDILITSKEYKQINKITYDVRSLLDYPIEQKPVEGDNETEIQKAFREGKNAGRQEVFDHPEEYGLQKEQKPWKVGANAYFTPEQKPAETQDYSGLNDLERAILRGFLCAGVENVPVTIIKETAKECLAQIKPAEWSDTNELVFKDICKHLKEEGYNGWIVLLNTLRNGEFQPKQEQNDYITPHKEFFKFIYDRLINVYKENPNVDYMRSFKERLDNLSFGEKQEWSEEDEKMINTIVSVLGQYIDYKAVSGTGSGYAIPRYSKEIDWLNSLRPSWKPSEEQMETLLGAKGVLRNLQYNDWAKILASLYEQLKKL